MSDTEDGLLDEDFSTGNDSDVLFSSEPSTSTSEPFETLTIPYRSRPSQAKIARTVKHSQEEDLLTSAKNCLSTLTERANQRSPQSTEEVFSDYIARSLKSIKEEKARRLCEFKIHQIIIEALMEQDKQQSASNQVNII